LARTRWGRLQCTPPDTLAQLRGRNERGGKGEGEKKNGERRKGEDPQCLKYVDANAGYKNVKRIIILVKRSVSDDA